MQEPRTIIVSRKPEGGAIISAVANADNITADRVIIVVCVVSCAADHGERMLRSKEFRGQSIVSISDYEPHEDGMGAARKRVSYYLRNDLDDSIRTGPPTAATAAPGRATSTTLLGGKV